MTVVSPRSNPVSPLSVNSWRYNIESPSDEFDDEHGTQDGVLWTEDDSPLSILRANARAKMDRYHIKNAPMTPEARAKLNHDAEDEILASRATPQFGRKIRMNPDDFSPSRPRPKLSAMKTSSTFGEKHQQQDDDSNKNSQKKKVRWVLPDNSKDEVSNGRRSSKRRPQRRHRGSRNYGESEEKGGGLFDFMSVFYDKDGSGPTKNDSRHESNNSFLSRFFDPDNDINSTTLDPVGLWAYLDPGSDQSSVDSASADSAEEGSSVSVSSTASNLSSRFGNDVTVSKTTSESFVLNSGTGTQGHMLPNNLIDEREPRSSERRRNDEYRERHVESKERKRTTDHVAARRKKIDDRVPERAKAPVGFSKTEADEKRQRHQTNKTPPRSRSNDTHELAQALGKHRSPKTPRVTRSHTEEEEERSDKGGKSHRVFQSPQETRTKPEFEETHQKDESTSLFTKEAFADLGFSPFLCNAYPVNFAPPSLPNSIETTKSAPSINPASHTDRIPSMMASSSALNAARALNQKYRDLLKANAATNNGGDPPTQGKQRFDSQQIVDFSKGSTYEQESRQDDQGNNRRTQTPQDRRETKHGYSEAPEASQQPGLGLPNLQKSPTNLQKSPSNSQKSPSNSQKSPPNSQKSPSNSQKSPSNSRESKSDPQKSKSNPQKDVADALAHQSAERKESASSFPVCGGSPLRYDGYLGKVVSEGRGECYPTGKMPPLARQIQQGTAPCRTPFRTDEEAISLQILESHDISTITEESQLREKGMDKDALRTFRMRQNLRNQLGKVLCRSLKHDPAKLDHDTDLPAYSSPHIPAPTPIKRHGGKSDGSTILTSSTLSDSGEGSALQIGKRSSWGDTASNLTPQQSYCLEYDTGGHMNVAYSQFGGDAREVIHVCEYTQPPVPLYNEMSIKIEASTISHTDCAVRRGDWWNDGNAPMLPRVPGVALVGRIHHVDSRAPQRDHARVGERVMALVRSGGNSRYLCVGRDQLVQVPETIDPSRAVCLTETYLTAFQVLHTGQKTGVRYRKTSLAGKFILVLGGATSLGQAVIELARVGGAFTVYATAKPKQFDSLRSLGAIPLNRAEQGWLDTIENRIDIVIGARIDTVANEDVTPSHIRALNDHGQLVVIEGPGCDNSTVTTPVTAHPSRLLCTSSRAKMLKRTHFYSVFEEWDRNIKLCQRDLTYLLELLQDGLVDPKIIEKIPLGKVGKAQNVLESKRMNGFIVCEPWIRRKGNSREEKRIEV